MVITFGIANNAPADPGDLVSVLATSWAAAYPSSAIPSNITAVKAVARVAQEGDVPTVVEATIGTSGAAGTGLAPQNCAMLCTKQTGKSGRRHKGRWYLPWVMEADVGILGDLTTAARGANDSRMSGFRNALSAADLPMVLLHSTPKTGTAGLPDIVVGMATEAIIGTIRRRMRK